MLIHSLTYPLIHLIIQKPIYLHPSIHLLVQFIVHPSIYQSIIIYHLSVHSSIHSSNHSSHFIHKISPSLITLNQKTCGSGDAWMRHERDAGRLARTLTYVGALGSSRRGGVTTLNTYVCSSDPATLLAIHVYEPAWNSLTLLILSSDFSF